MAKYLKRTGCLLGVFLVITGIASFYWLSPGQTEKRTVTIGFFEYPPYSMIDPETKRPTGYCVDILEAIAQNQNLEIKYVDALFADYPNSISNGKPYIMGLPIIITPERQKIYNFSWPCDENRTIIVVKKGSSLQKDSDLKRRVIGTAEGVEENYCQKLREEGKIKSYKTYLSVVKQFDALATGKVDAIIIDRSIALYFQTLHPNVFELADIVLFDHYDYKGFPIQKKQEWLLKRVNNGLRQIMNSNEYSRIYRKYFPHEGD